MGGEVERQRGEVGRDGRGEKGHGGDKERKEETGLSSAPGAEDLALPDGVGAELQLKKQRFKSGRASLSSCTGERDRDCWEDKSWPGAQGLPDPLSSAAPRTLGAWCSVKMNRRFREEGSVGFCWVNRICGDSCTALSPY